MRDGLHVTLAFFEPVDLQTTAGDWPLQLHVIGTGFAHRALPLAALIGDIELDQVTINPDGDGFTGLVPQTPPDGAVLRIGWADGPLIDTGVTFQSGGDV